MSVSLRLETRDVATRASVQVQSIEVDMLNGSFCNLYALALGLALYIFATKCSSPIKGETALHCCDPASPVLVMLESRNVFYVVSAFQSIVCLSTKSVLELFSFILTAYLRGGSRIILRRGAPLRNGVTGWGGSPPAPSP